MIRPVYITVMLDALIFLYTVRLVAAGGSLTYFFAFALGRVLGVFLGNIIDNKLALGTIEITVNKHLDEGMMLADTLRDKGYSVTTFKGYGIEGKERLVLSIVIPRKHLAELKHILYADGRVNMSVKDVSKTYGKVGKLILVE